jgi:N-acetyltransferase
MSVEIQPINLLGDVVKLEPLALEHYDALCHVGLDDELWQWTTTQIHSAGEMKRYIESALEAQAVGTALPFAIVERKGMTVVGSTRYGNIDLTHRRVEIGWTWIARAWQRTGINTEAKYLMLRHAFEHLGCLRVEFKTDVLNNRSRAALLRLGAKEEGVLRRHMVTSSGRIRDTVYYSIVDTEWAEVKARLQALLHARR